MLYDAKEIPWRSKEAPNWIPGLPVEKCKTKKAVKEVATGNYTVNITKYSMTWMAEQTSLSDPYKVTKEKASINVF